MVEKWIYFQQATFSDRGGNSSRRHHLPNSCKYDFGRTGKTAVSYTHLVRELGLGGMVSVSELSSKRRKVEEAKDTDRLQPKREAVDAHDFLISFICFSPFKSSKSFL